MVPIQMATQAALAFPAILMLAVLALSIGTGPLARLDRNILAMVARKTAPIEDLKRARRLETAARDITALGGDTFLILAALAGTALLMQHKGSRSALAFLLFLAGARFLGWLMKALHKRERPPPREGSVETFTSSFPSVHTLMSFVTAFGIFFAGLGPRTPAAISLVVASLVSSLVGSTRLYFGVHWPSDVAAGFLSGFMLSLIYIGFAAF
jgi:undecaprenyl-diphosphatase